jgi:hypothetical protein
MKRALWKTCCAIVAPSLLVDDGAKSGSEVAGNCRIHQLGATAAQQWRDRFSTKRAQA